jgi:hypothetical protein
MSPKRVLIGYTVFQRPRDFPEAAAVVRPWCLYPRDATPQWPFIRPQGDAPGTYAHPIACLCDSLEDAREPFIARRLYRVNRLPGDDKVIAEVWV